MNLLNIKKFLEVRKIPAKYNELRTFYKQMIDNISGLKLNLIFSKKVKINGSVITKYNFNNNLIKNFYEISVRNGKEHNYNFDLLKIFNIDKPIDYKKYCFRNK